MGGYGTGRYYRSKKTVIEDYRCLDINRMVKLGSIQPDTRRSGSWTWTNTNTGERVSSFSYTSNTLDPHDMYLNVSYTTVSTDKRHDYNIRIERTSLHYGGHRYWFICPYTGRRVAKLYGANGADKYGSRHAFNLSYASQSEASHDRALRKKWKLLDKVGGDQDWPLKPKGMHQKTFERLLDKFYHNEDIIEGHLVQFLKGMMVH
ncbi:MAG: hypothetical protein COA45_12405 [Zetaproteobacteria bacterium]|nr:MAG: hypothetical protein COA45_12405 [Zetaproteobacteria bacterium]